MILLVSTVAQLVAAIIALNFIVRTIVFTTLKFFGAYDPRWDQLWPRFPWRPFWLVGWIRFGEWKEENFGSGQASAGLAGAVTQLALTYEQGQSLIGHVRLPLGIKSYSLVGEKSERHKVYVASARSGKSLQLQTELALMPVDACALVIDPKGHHTTQILYKLEKRGHELCVIDPFSLTDRPTQRICLLTQIDLFNERMCEDRTTILCDRIASLFFPHNSSAKTPFFDDMGREGWARLMCFAKHKFKTASMVDVRRLVSRGYHEHAPDDPDLAFRMLWEEMLACDIYDGYVSSFAAQVLSMDARTRESILATIRSKTGFLDHAQVQAVSIGNDVNLCDLKNPDSNLILSLPVNVGDMKATLRPWIGAIVSFSLAVMEWLDSDLKTKTRFVIEEAQAIGETALPGLGDKAALMAGMGLSLTVVVQDFPGFQKGFPNDWKSVLGNAQHVVFMACNDPQTYEFVAHKALGAHRVKKKKWCMPFLWAVSSYEKQVMTPDQVRRFLEAGKGSAIVMRNGKKSMFVKIAKSFDLLPVWMINPSKDHGETPARAWFRGIWREWQANRPQGSLKGDMTREDAKALFGLTEPFTAREVASRASCLSESFPPQMIADARRMLEV